MPSRRAEQRQRASMAAQQHSQATWDIRPLDHDKWSSGQTSGARDPSAARLAPVRSARVGARRGAARPPPLEMRWARVYLANEPSRPSSGLCPAGVGAPQPARHAHPARRQWGPHKSGGRAGGGGGGKTKGASKWAPPFFLSPGAQLRARPAGRRRLTSALGGATRESCQRSWRGRASCASCATRGPGRGCVRAPPTSCERQLAPARATGKLFASANLSLGGPDWPAARSLPLGASATECPSRTRRVRLQFASLHVSLATAVAISVVSPAPDDGSSQTKSSRYFKSVLARARRSRRPN